MKPPNGPSAGRVLVSFPAVREVLSEPTGAPAWQSYQKLAGLTPSHLPPMLYHIEVVPRVPAPEPDDSPAFVSASRGWLGELAHRLALPGSAAGGYDLVPRELPPRAPSPPSCSETLIGVSSSFNGRSWCLSAAVGMAAVAIGRAIPPWVVCSGCLPHEGDLTPGLELCPTGLLDRKVRLCAGRAPDHDPAAEPRWRCGGGPGCELHGPAELRAVPGRVRLLVLARPTLLQARPPNPRRVVDGMPESVCQGLGLRPARAEVNALGRGGLAEVLSGLAGGAMLVLQVPSVWHALTALDLRLPAAPANVRVAEETVLGYLLPPEGLGVPGC